MKNLKKEKIIMNIMKIKFEIIGSITNFLIKLFWLDVDSFITDRETGKLINQFVEALNEGKKIIIINPKNKDKNILIKRIDKIKTIISAEDLSKIKTSGTTKKNVRFDLPN